MKNPISAGKVFLTVFFEVNGPIFLNSSSTEVTIYNSNIYCETIQRLLKFIKNKWQELLTEDAVLLQDNTRSHVSRVTHIKRAKFKGEQLDHSQYSSDMSPCDFFEFGLLKKHLKGQPFNSNDEFKDALKD